MVLQSNSAEWAAVTAVSRKNHRRFIARKQFLHPPPPWPWQKHGGELGVAKCCWADRSGMITASTQICTSTFTVSLRSIQMVLKLDFGLRLCILQSLLFFKRTSSWNFTLCMAAERLGVRHVTCCIRGGEETCLLRLKGMKNPLGSCRNCQTCHQGQCI